MSLADFTARLDRLQLPWFVARTMSWFLAIHAFVVGWDYVHTPNTASAAKSLAMVERMASLHTWGLWYVAVGSVLVVGLAFRRHAVVWLGHFGLMIMYAGFAVATLQAVYRYAQTPLEVQEGPVWRAVTSAFLLAAFHGLLCWTRGPVPRRGEPR